MKKTLIVTGGTLDMPFAAAYAAQEKFDYTIASDAGMHFFSQMGTLPDELLGDFDSADADELQYFMQKPRVKVHRYPVKKDATDTELALALALSSGSDEIHILGATGTRLDHVLGAVHLLGAALERDIPCYLVDAHNRVRLIRGRTVLHKKEQYGHYVSLIPLTTQVRGVTLTGFLYPLTDHTLCMCTTLGVSNELVEDTGVITLTDGVLIVIESKD